MDSSGQSLTLFVLLFVSFSCAQDNLPFVCDFEGASSTINLCGMIQQNDDQFDWDWIDKATPTAETGPPSAQNGIAYMYIETSNPREEGNIAKISTNNLRYSGTICVDFYYYMYGRDIGTNALQLYTRDPLGVEVTVWSQSGEKGQNWLQARQTVTGFASGSRIGWLGRRGVQYQSDIAVDNIRITRGSCDAPATPQPTTTTTTRRPDGSETGPTTAPTPTDVLVNLPFRCDFENPDICNMVQLSTDQFDWTRQSGGTPSADTGPSLAQSGSYYMYIEASDPRQLNDRAILETPMIRNTGSACLTFYYHMKGRAIKDLIIYLASRGLGEPLRTISNAQGDLWIRAQISLSLRDNDRVGFVGVRGNDISGDIAIDTVNIAPGSCEGGTPAPSPTPSPTPAPTQSPRPERNLPYACDFEFDFCGMFQRITDQYDWVRQRGETQTEGTGPITASRGSYYIYSEVSSPRQQGDRAYIETPSLTFAGAICLRFDYNMYGSDVASLIAFTSNNQEETTIFNVMGNQGQAWLRAEIDTSISYGERIIWRADVGPQVRGDIAIDNVDITVGNCRAVEPTPSPSPSPTPSPGPEPVQQFARTTCDGERDGNNNQQCRMRQDNSGAFNWMRNTGRTRSGIDHDRRIDGSRYPVTGPERAQSGNFYMYVEASGRTNGDRAKMIIEGDDFRRGGRGCLRFFYSMNGHHTGQLSVYYRLNNGPEKLAWAMTGDQKQNWNRAAVDFKDMNGITEIGFSAVMTGHFSGDIAVDEIQMSQGLCESIPAPYIWICNFELRDQAATLCNMDQQTNDQFDWTLWKGRTHSDETGPERAYNGDFYIYTEASKPRVTGDTASILIPRLDRTGDMCLEFRYNMNGFHTGTLQVYTSRGGFDQSNRWTLTGDQGREWSEERVTIENLQFDEQIGFRGVRGTEFSSDMAIDNIRVRPNRC